jgi:hypothetical protein
MRQYFGCDILKPSPPAFPELDLARKPQGLRAFLWLARALRRIQGRRIRPASHAIHIDCLDFHQAGNSVANQQDNDTCSRLSTVLSTANVSKLKLWA